MSENEISRVVVNSAYQVHKELGPGLLENIYEHCMLYELQDSGLHIIQQRALPVTYKDRKLDLGYRLDLWVNNKVIIEIKAVNGIEDIHIAQLLTYLKLTDNKLGLLINFNVPLIKDGIRRVVNNL